MIFYFTYKIECTKPNQSNLVPYFLRQYRRRKRKKKSWNLLFSPVRKSWAPVDGFVDFSSPELLSDSSGPLRCVYKEPEHPEQKKKQRFISLLSGSYRVLHGEALTTICSSVLLRSASSNRLARSLRLQFWNVSVSTWSWETKTFIHLPSQKDVQKRLWNKRSPEATAWSSQTPLPEISSAVREPSSDLTIIRSTVLILHGKRKPVQDKRF